jgi:hypothetical protein
MAGKRGTDHTFGALSARLIIAGVLDELRDDPESFARLLVAVSQVRQADVSKVVLLLATSGDPRTASTTVTAR